LATKIFWAFFIADCLGLLVLWVLASQGRSSPEGPVGGWLLLIPPVAMVLLLATVLLWNTDGVKATAACLLGFPWIFVVIGPLYTAFRNHQAEESVSGNTDFRGKYRKLKDAIAARDLDAVHRLIPESGDLNQLHGDDTYLSFAVHHLPDHTKLGSPVSQASIDILQALLDAGAKADQATPNGVYPLTTAIYAGPEFTAALLKAGANPNRLDHAQRPLWWSVLSHDNDQDLRTLEVLLDHGADVTLRHREGGPVGWAAYNARMSHGSSWRMVSLLIDRGAAWKAKCNSISLWLR